MITKAVNKSKINAMAFKTAEKIDIKKAAQNSEYLEMLDRGIKQIKKGRGIILTNAELERMINE